MKAINMRVAGGLVLALVLALVMIQPAVAARGEPSYYVIPSFSQLDLNGDGGLDRGEVQGRAPLYGQWSRFDENSDGLIEPAEFAAFEEAVSETNPTMVRPGARPGAEGLAPAPRGGGMD